MRQWLMCEGECVNETLSTFFIRARGGGGGGGDKKKKKPAPVAEPAPREVIYQEQQVVAQDQSVRYAHASGDMNPIHLDNEVARSVGLPSIILHGLCTMAFASRAVVQGVCAGDPNRLHRLKVRFTKPVLPGWTLTTRVWREGQEEGRQVFGLETVNQDGVVVLTQALAEVKEVQA
jgi:acyl dehydratase